MNITSLYQRLVILFILVFFLWFGKPFLIPIAYAFLTSLVLYPITRFFERKGFGRSLSILLPILMVTILFAGLVSLLSYELVILGGKWPLIQQQFDPFLDRVQFLLESEFGWATENQVNWARSTLDSLSQNAIGYLQYTLHAAFEALFNFIIIPIYVALILFYRRRLAAFATSMMPEKYQGRMPEVMSSTVNIFSQFIRGMTLVYLIVGLLNTLGLWLLGVENPFTYGMITAIMTIIPYFGIIISALLPIVATWLETESLLIPLGIVGVFAVVQYIEANLIFPYVVGRFVDLNTLAAIVAIFLGALIWGVSGMILFLPFFSVFRLVASHFPELTPWRKILEK